MFLSFRNGIVHMQSPQSGPPLLQRTALSQSSIDLVIVQNNPVLITFAHYSANYIVSENNTVVGAWGGDDVGSTNGPLTAGQTQYLFWDISLSTGALTRGWTPFSPIYTSSPPTSPAVGQMWFDNINTVWKVWAQNGTNPGMWIDKIRCFAGTYSSNAIIIISPVGSQIIPPITGNFTGGNLILGTNNVPLKNSDGTFVTTATSLIIQETSGQNISLDASLSFGEASENIPAFYLVSFNPYKLISLASNLNSTSFVSGIVTEPLYKEQVGRVITSGVVRNDQWSWDPSAVNSPLFCGPSGEVTLNPPGFGVHQQIGVIYDTSAILLNIGPAIRIRS